MRSVITTFSSHIHKDFLKNIKTTFSHFEEYRLGMHTASSKDCLLHNALYNKNPVPMSG